MIQKKTSTASKRRTSTSPAKVVIPQLSWDQVRPASIVLVSGAEDFLADEAITLLRDVLRSEDSSLEIHDMTADAYQAGQLVTVASPSLFNEPRLIRIRNVEKCSDVFMDDMSKYLKNPAPDAYVVVRHAGGVRGKKLLEQIRGLESGGVEIVCNPLKRDNDRQVFAGSEFRSAGRRIAPAALRQLVSAMSDDLAELSAACRQLMADTEGDISQTTVDRYHGGRMTVTGFAVADSAVAGRYQDALVALRHALASGADPVPVVAAFAMKVRTMAKVHGMRGSTQSIASELGVVSWQVEKAQRDLAGWTTDGLRRCVSTIADTDAQVKGAGRDPHYALERMVSIVSSRGAR